MWSDLVWEGGVNVGVVTGVIRKQYTHLALFEFLLSNSKCYGGKGSTGPCSCMLWLFWYAWRTLYMYMHN